MSGPDFYKYIRAFNRLEKAIQRHMDAKAWTDDADDSLHHAWRQVMKDVGPVSHVAPTAHESKKEEDKSSSGVSRATGEAA